MAPRRIYVRLGNRGGALAILSVLWIALGYGLLTAPTPRQVNLPDEDWPIELRSAMWFVPGLVALLTAVLRGAGWRRRAAALRLEPWAWTLLMLPLSESVCVRAYAAARGDYPAAWLGAVIYAGFGVLVYFCARGLDRPPPMPRVPHRNGSGAT